MSEGRPARREDSAGGVVVRTLGGADHFLLIRDPYANWGLPKGHVEGEEDPRDAALREVREETGLEALEPGPELGTIDWYFRLDGELIHKYCRFFLMRSSRGEPVPEEEEGITACRWLPVGDAIREISYDNTREILRIAARRLTGGEGSGDAPAPGSGPPRYPREIGVDEPEG